MRKILLSVLSLMAVNYCIGQEIWGENFEDGVPSSMTEEQITGEVSWGINGGSAGPADYPYSGDNSATFYEDSFTEYQTALVSPTFDGTGAGALQFAFAHVQPAWDTDQNTLLVEVSADDGESWTVVEDFTTDISNWQISSYDLDNFIEATALMKVRFTGTSEYGRSVGLDEISVSLISCPAPTDFAATNQTSTSVDLNWTAGSDEAAWNVQYGEPGFDPELVEGTLLSATSNTDFEISGLTPATQYEVYVQAECIADTDLSEWVGPVSFATLCETITTLPYCMGFEADEETNCWTVLDENADGDAWILNDDDDPNSGEFEASMYTDYNSGNNDDWLISPKIELSGNEQLSFYLRTQSSSEINDVEVLLSTTSTDPSAFTEVLMPLTEFDNTSYEELILDLSAYSGEVHIAFHIPADGPDGWRLYLDDVCVHEIPSCVKPDELEVVSTTVNTATLSWLAGQDETSWNIQYGTPGFDPAAEEGTIVTANSNTDFEITGLSGGALYEVYVQAECVEGVDLSLWEGSVEVTTGCPDSFSPEYVQEFNDFVPLCWQEAEGGTPDEGPTEFETGGWSSGDFADDGSPAARVNIYSYSTPDDRDWLISPSIDLTGGPFQLDYDFAITEYNETIPGVLGSDDEVQLLISTDDGATWTNLTTYDSSYESPEDGESIIVDLSGYAGETVQFAFYATNGDVNDDADTEAYVDDFRVREIPSCPAVTDLELIELEANMAILSWVAGSDETQWEVQYGAPGFDPVMDEGTTVAASTNTGFELTGIDAETEYDVYVQAICEAGVDESEWHNNITFTTPPTCPDPSGLSAANVTAGSVELSWTEGGDETTWDVQYGAPGFDPEANEGTTVSATTNTDFELTGLDSETDYEVFVKAVCEAGVDESNWSNGVEFTTPQTCPDPSGLSVANVTAGSVELSWTEGSDETAWDVQYGAPGFDPEANEGTTVSASTNTDFELTGLDPETEYEVFVKAVCEAGVDESYWSDGEEFTTIATCPVPTDFESLGATASTIELQWIAGGSETNWNVQYGAPDFDPVVGEGTTVDATSNSGFELTDLTANTEYEIYVQAECVEGTDFSYWVGPITVTTDCEVFTPEYIEDFAEMLPECWSESTEGLPSEGPTALGNSDWSEEDFVNDEGEANQAASINIYTFSWGTPDDQEWLISPSIDLTGGPFQVDYDFAITEYNESVPAILGSDDEVQLLITTDDGETWTNLITYDDSYVSPEGGEMVEFDLSDYSGETVKLAFWATDGEVIDEADVDVFVDNFRVREIPECPEPTALTISEIDATSASLSWEAGGEETEWSIQYGAPGFDPEAEEGTVVSASSNTDFELTGLDPETEYEVYVQAICEAGSNISMWAANATFSTLPTCPQPTDLSVEDVTTETAILSWTAGSDETSWNIQYGAPGFDPTAGEGTVVTASTNTDFELTGLDPETLYDIYVQAECIEDTDLSTWTEPVTIYTPCIVEPVTTYPWTENFDELPSPILPCGWTQENLNEDDQTWFTYNDFALSGENSLVVFYNTAEAMNDWAYTPELVLEAGETYSFQFSYRASTLGYEENLEVYLGDAASSESMNEELVDITGFTSAEYTTQMLTFTVPEDGSYYIGFHGYSQADQYFIAIDDVELDICPTDASFSYSTDTLCVYNELLLPEITGMEGGTFSADTGLDIDPETGEIDPENSDLGEYEISYEVTGENGCMDVQTFTILIDLCSGIDEVDGLSSISIYPNPANSIVNVDLSGLKEQVKLDLMDMTGKVVISETMSNPALEEINISSLENGIYMIRISNGAETTTKRIVVSK